MKKLSISGAVAVLVVVLAGAGWAMFLRGGDPVQNARQALLKGDLRSAAIELRSALRDDPANVQAHLMLSETQLVQGDYVAAEKEAKAARDLNADPIAVAKLLGQAYVGQRNWKDLLAEIPAEAPTPEARAALLVLRATAQGALGDWPAANASLAKAEADAPRNVDVRLAGARLAAARQDMALSEQKVNEALELAPKRSDVLDMKGVILAGRGDRAGGLAMIDQAVANAPDQTTFRLERAGLLLSMGNDAKARADIDAVLAKEPRNSNAIYTGMVLLVRAGKFAEADNALLLLDPVISRFPRGLFFSALVKSNLGRTAEAEELARRYVARAPADLDGQRLLARILIAAKRPGQAIEVLNKAVALAPSDPETLDLLGRAYAAAGQGSEAAKLFQQASTLAPQSADILARLASTKMQLGDLPGATTAFEKSLEIAPGQTGISEALVAAALSSGDLDRAQTLLDKLRQQVGETEQVGLLTGLVRLAKMDADGARAAFEATATRFPESQPAKLNLAKTLLMVNRRDDAIAQLKAILAKSPASAPALSLLVQILLQDRRGPDAMEAAETARTAAPGNLGLVAGEAELAARLGDPARGLAILDASHPAGAPMPPVLLPLLARLNIAAGKPDAAKAIYAQILATTPGNGEARRGMVDLLVGTGDVTGAQASLRDGLKVSPTDLGMMEALVQTEQRARGFDAALALADQLRAVPAYAPTAAVLKGDLYIAAKRYDDARRAYDAEFKAAPSTQLALRLASAEMAAGNADQAYAGLKAYQAKQPTDIALAQSIGAMDVTARRYAEAEKNLQLVLSARPNDPVALNNLAWTYQAQGDKRARPLAQRAYMEAPTPELGDTLGWIMLSDGEAAKALPILQQASTQRPANLTMRFHVAAALKALDRRDEAVTLLRPLVDDPADFDDKPAARQMLADLTAAK